MPAEKNAKKSDATRLTWAIAHMHSNALFIALVCFHLVVCFDTFS